MNGPLWTATEAAAALGAEFRSDWAATGVSIDSRAVKPGDLFIAIIGDRLDGHVYVKKALEAGAVGAIVHHTPEGLDAGDTRLLIVEDTLAALECLGSKARRRSDARVVAVTGSVGKTGAKEMLRLTLGALGSCHVSEGNLNNHWGAPLSMARMPRAVDFAAFELGMNHPGEIRPLVKLAQPDVAIITRIAPAHTAFFDSIEAVADAKAEIFEGLTPGGIAVLNADDPMIDRLSHAASVAGVKSILRFGEASDADVRLVFVALEETGSTIQADILGHQIHYRLGAPGRHWVKNSLAVLAAIQALGADVETAAAAMADVRPPAGRGERRQLAGGFDLIDESYNASPAAVRAAFATLALAEPKVGGRRIVVLGDMLELGARSAADHAGLGTAFAEAKLDYAHAAGPECKHFMAALPTPARGHWAEDAAGLANSVDDLAAAGDIVLVKGSLGMGMAKVVKALEGIGNVT
jgi:UDP-N-acetylmuramoyl-tripeptide--D-alanyl-D-alanine ligase